MSVTTVFHCPACFTFQPLDFKDFKDVAKTFKCDFSVLYSWFSGGYQL